MATQEQERAAMRRALMLAADPQIRPGANPRVGCVLLAADGSTLAEGVHRGAGNAHAEADALAQLRPGRTVDTAVVTLEPCNHHGRTPPCAEALFNAGARRVVYALPDPNPIASGGAQYLRDHGVDVEAGLLADEATRLDPAWFAAIRLGRPHVTWKFAATLDGRSAAADGTSQWITSPQARADVHRLRAAADAIIAGTGTIHTDDAQLTARPDGVTLEHARQPIRVVLGNRDLPRTARVLDEAAPTWQLTGHDPEAALNQLWDKGIRRCFLEGGPTLAAAFLRANLVDTVVAYLAPALLGAGRNAVDDYGITTITDLPRHRLIDVSRIGPDARLTLTTLTTATLTTATTLTTPEEGHCSPA